MAQRHQQKLPSLTVIEPPDEAPHEMTPAVPEGTASTSTNRLLPGVVPAGTAARPPTGVEQGDRSPSFNSLSNGKLARTEVFTSIDSDGVDPSKRSFMDSDGADPRKRACEHVTPTALGMKFTNSNKSLSSPVRMTPVVGSQALRSALTTAFMDLAPTFSSLLVDRCSDQLDSPFSSQMTANDRLLLMASEPSGKSFRSKWSTRTKMAPARAMKRLETNVAQLCLDSMGLGTATPPTKRFGLGSKSSDDLTQRVRPKLSNRRNAKSSEDLSRTEMEPTAFGAPGRPRVLRPVPLGDLCAVGATRSGPASSVSTLTDVARCKPPRLEDSSVGEHDEEGGDDDEDYDRQTSPSSQPKSPPSKVRSINRLMRGHFEALTMQAACAAGDEIPKDESGTLTSLDCLHQRYVPFALLASGMLPWRCVRFPWLPGLHFLFVRIIVAACAISWVAFFLIRHLSPTFAPWGFGFHQCLFAEVPIPVGAVCGIASFGLNLKAKRVMETFEVLGRVARDRGFEEWHSRHTRLPGLIFFTLWVCSVATYCAHQSVHDFSAQDMAATVVFAFFSGAILTLCFGMACVCRVLNIMIDHFCCDVVDNMALSETAHLWNVTSAVFRIASNSIEHCLFALCLIMACVLPLILVDFVIREDGVWGSLPSFTVACGVMYLILTAATISEKCTRVPALINAISFGPGSARERQALVDYINSSAAGFYVFGVRLTTSMVLKFAYAWCVVAVGLVTKVNKM